MFALGNIMWLQSENVATFLMVTFMQISVRELKNHLSKYLKLVRAGEAVVITSHKRPIARLISVEIDETDDLITQLTNIPGVKWRGGKPHGARIALTNGEKTAAEMVLEDRR